MLIPTSPRHGHGDIAGLHCASFMFLIFFSRRTPAAPSAPLAPLPPPHSPTTQSPSTIRVEVNNPLVSQSLFPRHPPIFFVDFDLG
jgi:hypothetical protein